VTAVNLTKKTVKTRHASLVSKSLVLATGTRMRRLVVEQGNHLASQVIYRVEEMDFAERPCVVIGGSDEAMETALSLAKRSPRVTLITELSHLEGRPDFIATIKKKRNIDVLLATKVCGLLGKERIAGVQIKTGGNLDEIFAPFVVSRI